MRDSQKKYSIGMSDFSLFGEITVPDTEAESSSGVVREPSQQHEFPDESDWWIVRKVKGFFKGTWQWIRARLGLVACKGSVCVHVGPHRAAVYEIQERNATAQYFGVRLYFRFQNLNECCGKFLYAKRDGVIAIEKTAAGGFVAKHGPDSTKVDSELRPDPGIQDNPDPRRKNTEGRLMPQGDGEWDDTPSIGIKQFSFKNYEARSSLTLWAYVKDECHGNVVDSVKILVWLRLVVQNGTIQHNQSGCKIQILEGRECS